ncbi:hypothetical protein FRC08_011718 [Ceratobasidium sp. 394]|nr:hypothetical protein FRC08_011718 [Ceratobasidium sp. 394]
MSQAPIRGPDKIRHRIEEITLEPTTSKYPISLKVLVDNVEVFRLPEIAQGQPLHWTSVPVCDVSRASEVTIRVYEIHTFGRKQRVASAHYIVSVVEGQPEAEIASDSRAYAAKITFFTPRPDEDAAAAALARAQEQAAVRQRRVLEKLGPTRNAIKTILDFGTAVAELHPTAKAVFAICNTAWQKLEAQERCDESVERLVTGLSGILPLVAIVEKAAKLPHLQSTVGSLLHLIEDAARFIVEYHTEGQIGQTARSLASSTAQARVDDLLQKLQRMEAEFDRGMAVQIFLQDQRTLLDKLNPVGKARYDPGRACLAGTRTDIIEKITTWCKTSNDPNRLLWVHGQAGLGKSTIAASVCQQLGENLLAASFFCKRDDQE